MNAKRAKKYNMRRIFFNKGKGKQCWCGGLIHTVTSLTGENRGEFCSVPHRGGAK